ncbi:hypothetical protein I4F81_011054 [Pyropia yezoensis]|uniref:Uncharacterized protein n=1 Tax=Pyropia yezoensis TaxID=2788 RepID=A0ACC3CF56_PYRYE|nr:hypothetical protein I4F81_011054 [Neopyropia yezoensis]
MRLPLTGRRRVRAAGEDAAAAVDAATCGGGGAVADADAELLARVTRARRAVGVPWPSALWHVPPPPNVGGAGAPPVPPPGGASTGLAIPPSARRPANTPPPPSALSIVRTYAAASVAVATYRLPDVHAALATLPPWEATSRDALSLAGRAHHEAAAYAPAAAAYAAALAAAPARLEGVVDYYSTALWQLRAAAPAVALASAAVAVDRGCPAAWVAAGNAFSLAGDADTALRFFRRAVQLDPGGAAYAYTLAGHELRGKAAAGPAAAAYRRALVVDGRAVGALYGLAALAEARDAWAEARGYYAAALAVAPRNGKLRYHLGAALWYELGRVEKAAGGGAAALRAFSTALGLAPRERRYKRALDTVYAVDEDDL